jgi:sulfur relay (sulfurtransferase) DsrF/TusC family protein
MINSVLILCDKGPFGTNSATEAVRLGSGFLGLGEDVECKIVFLGDGVLTMKNNLNAEQIGMDSLEEAMEMADLTDMGIILIKEDMETRGMKKEDIVEYENVSIISNNELSETISEFDTVFKI